MEMNNRQEIENGYPIRIAGVGRYLPSRNVTSEELEEKYGIEIGWCEKKVGIRERRFVSDETVTSMCVEAIKEACSDAKVELNQIDYMINAGSSYDQLMPDECVLVMKETGGFRKDIGYLSINSGCLSFMAALDMAASMIGAPACKYMVIFSGMFTSPMVETSKSIERYTVGDGAAAMVLSYAKEGEMSKILASRMETYGENSGVKGFLASDGSEATVLFNNKILSQGINYEFDTKQMQRKGMHYNKDFLMRLMPCSRKNIDLVIPNQTSRIVADMLRIMFPAKKIKTVIDRYGNLGAVGQMLAFYEAVREGELKRGDHLLLQAMGAGFSIYGMQLIY